VFDRPWHYWCTVSSTASKVMRWMGKALLWLVFALLVLAVSGAIYQVIAPQRAERDYPPPGEMVDAVGYSLHINCAGRGSPTVILDGGTGEMSANWGLVQREVSHTTRVCAYDRAGMGWSERGPEPRDARRITGELRALLDGAGIDGPYVLVGHSFGGLYMQTYAARHPDEVAGMSLIESSHPQQFGYRSVARGSYEPPGRISNFASLQPRIGAVRLFYKLFPAFPDLPPQQRAQIDALAPWTRQVDTNYVPPAKPSPRRVL
jgi:pimeloyl-ACP methyl ester carboxylesterase